jgi:hypothetical protein
MGKGGMAPGACDGGGRSAGGRAPEAMSGEIGKEGGSQEGARVGGGGGMDRDEREGV